MPLVHTDTYFFIRADGSVGTQEPVPQRQTVRDLGARVPVPLYGGVPAPTLWWVPELPVQGSLGRGCVALCVELLQSASSRGAEYVLCVIFCII